MKETLSCPDSTRCTPVSFMEIPITPDSGYLGYLDGLVRRRGMYLGGLRTCWA